MLNQTDCPDCKHEAHEPGKCEQCNCGDSEISHSGAMTSDYTRVVTWQNYQQGNVSTKDVTHIKARTTGND